jgi:hypothetical protein
MQNNPVKAENILASIAIINNDYIIHMFLTLYSLSKREDFVLPGDTHI